MIRSSTSASVASLSRPQCRPMRSFATERMSSHFMKLRDFRPPSGGSTRTWNGTPFDFVVNGRMTNRSAGPLLKRSADNIKAGRRPACSCPRTGSRSTVQTSPRRGTLIRRPQGRPSKLCPTPHALQVLPPMLSGPRVDGRMPHCLLPEMLGVSTFQRRGREYLALAARTLPRALSACDESPAEFVPYHLP